MISPENYFLEKITNIRGTIRGGTSSATGSKCQEYDRVDERFKIPKIKSALISIGPTELKVEFLESVKLLKDIGYKIYSTKGTHDLLIKEEIESTLLNKAEGNQSNNVIDYIKLKKILKFSKTSSRFQRKLEIPKNIIKIF